MGAPKGNDYAEGNGRPSKYKEEYPEQVYKLCLLGAINKDIADFFEVTEQTIANWKNEYPSFFDAIKRGKAVADMTVANSLFERANGSKVKKQSAFKTKSTRTDETTGKILTEEKIEIVELEEELPPDTTAIIFWLKNRNPENWRDKTEVDNKLTLMPLITQEEIQKAKESFSNEL